MMITLKHYQQRTLAKLTAFLEQARFAGAEYAFREHQEAQGYSKQYKTLAKLEDIPYICLRLPTGGGKTLLSAHAVAIAAASYLESDYPLALWLCPTDTIRSQTLETLNNPLHPNRQALDKQFDGRVRIFDITDFTLLQQGDLGHYACVFVATFAAFRVNSTDGRKVYGHHELLEPHFVGLPAAAEYLEAGERGKYSFANLLAHYQPMIIVDEAHNNTSKLSIEVLQRLRPAAIIEFTATPADNSNVLYKVSASELKAEDMIKLPVRLVEHTSWEDAVTNAVQTRQRLDEAAQGEDRYIRPIVLFQAEAKDKDVTVDVMVRYLTEQEGIPREQIAIATGNQRELDGVNLFAPSCPINYVITVQALKEGWDCSFAYVFCSLARVQSSKEAEQLLGRVLRMPYAKRRFHDELNRAYAHVAVTTWAEAVAKMRDNLIGMGFEDVEAEVSVQVEPLFPEAARQTAAWQEEVVLYTAAKPELASLNLALQAGAQIEQADDGYKVTITVSDRRDLTELLAQADTIFPGEADQQQLQAAVKRVAAAIRPLTLAETGATVTVPQLCLDFGDGEGGVADRESFLPGGWNLLDFPVGLDSFQVTASGQLYELDIRGTKVIERPLASQEALSLGTATHWTETQLVTWLDRKLRQPDVPYGVLTEFLHCHVRYLLAQKQSSLPDLVRLRFVLQHLLRAKIDACREEAYRQGVQTVLLQTPQAACLSPEAVTVFREGKYPVNARYRGSVQFRKHFFPLIADMNDEEVQCARAIDSTKGVKTWIRNIERQPETSFWLPTSHDRFYPDFVAELTDGRILVIEYKGGHLVTTADTQEKEQIGKLWAERSNGQCLFLLATQTDAAGRGIFGQIGHILSVSW